MQSDFFVYRILDSPGLFDEVPEHLRRSARAEFNMNLWRERILDRVSATY